MIIIQLNIYKNDKVFVQKKKNLYNMTKSDSVLTTGFDTANYWKTSLNKKLQIQMILTNNLLVFK